MGDEELEKQRFLEAQRLSAIFEPRVGMPVSADGNALLIDVPDADTITRDECVCALQEVGFNDSLFKEVQVAVLDVATRTKDVKQRIPLPLRMSAGECARVKAASRQSRDSRGIAWNATSAMNSLFGDYDPNVQGYKWTASVPKGNEELSGFDGQPLVAKILTSGQYSENGVERVMLAAWSKPVSEYDCHSCAVLISAFVLKQEGNGWKVEHQSKYLGAAGSWGNPPESARVIRDSNGTPALAVSGSYMAQGEISDCSWVAVAENGTFSIRNRKR